MKLIKYFLSQQNKIREIYWANVFEFAIKNSEWLYKKNFNAGRWALGFPALYILYRCLNDIKPKSIIEFGLGESSKMTYQYLISHPETNLKIIEQDSEFLDFFTKQSFDIKDNVILLPVENKQIKGDKKTYVYANLLENISEQKYDLVLIDGPWGSDYFSRSELIDIVENDLLQKEFMIIVDDYERKGEQQTVKKALEIFSQKGIKIFTGKYAGEKTTLIICSEKYKFLCSV
jgi:16S rRNA G966 N2-methylase RsmD